MIKKNAWKFWKKKKKRKNELINCKKSKFIIKVHWVMIIMKHTKPLICGHKKKSPFYPKHSNSHFKVSKNCQASELVYHILPLKIRYFSSSSSFSNPWQHKILIYLETHPYRLHSSMDDMPIASCQQEPRDQVRQISSISRWTYNERHRYGTLNTAAK